jgi:hypothetical protein
MSGAANDNVLCFWLVDKYDSNIDFELILPSVYNVFLTYYSGANPGKNEDLISVRHVVACCLTECQPDYQ